MEDLNMSDKLHGIYLKSFRKGRGAAAGTIDRTFFFCLSAALVWLAVRARMANLTVSIVVTCASMLIVLTAAAGIERIGLRRHAARMRRDAEAEILEEKARIHADELLGSIKAPGAFVCRSVECVSADDVLKAIACGCRSIVSLSQPTSNARELMAAAGISLEDPFIMLGKKPSEIFSVTDTEIDERLYKKYCKKERRTFGGIVKSIKPLAGERAVRYMLTGAALILLSFAEKYSLSYRLLGSLSMSLGAAIFGFDILKSKRMA